MGAWRRGTVANALNRWTKFCRYAALRCTLGIWATPRKHGTSRFVSAGSPTRVEAAVCCLVHFPFGAGKVPIFAEPAGPDEMSRCSAEPGAAIDDASSGRSRVGSPGDGDKRQRKSVPPSARDADGAAPTSHRTLLVADGCGSDQDCCMSEPEGIQGLCRGPGVPAGYARGPWKRGSPARVPMASRRAGPGTLNAVKPVRAAASPGNMRSVADMQHLQQFIGVSWRQLL